MRFYKVVARNVLFILKPVPDVSEEAARNSFYSDAWEPKTTVDKNGFIVEALDTIENREAIKAWWKITAFKSRAIEAGSPEDAEFVRMLSALSETKLGKLLLDSSLWVDKT
ncbi:MAG: hypothetical protein QXW32_06430 [Nitrososphaerales archaeon]